MKKVGKIIGRVLLGFVFVAIALLIVRVLMQSDSSVLKCLSVNNTLRTAYADATASTFAMTHNVPYQISAAVTAEHADAETQRLEGGYFSAYGFVYVPAARQLQIVVRYNNYVYDKLNTENGHEFTFVLRNGTTGERILPTYTEAAAKWMYQYRRLVFDNVTLDGENDWWIDLSVSEDTATVNSLVCHYADQYRSSMKEYRLSSSEKKALLSPAD